MTLGALETTSDLVEALEDHDTDTGPRGSRPTRRRFTIEFNRRIVA
ncbi:hypothetical protein [Nesterenkonia muleiensis]|nr:hypothetical protein [Nesterenkonia muleiensis]